MNEVTIPDGVERRQVRMYCPMCGRQVPVIFYTRDTSGGKVDVCCPLNPCPYCGARQEETTAVNQYAYVGVRTT
jgi:uncharacterized protein (UPF0212 family)